MASLQRRIQQRMNELIEPRRRDTEFMQRLERRIREDKPILDRLKAMDRDEQNRATEVLMSEIRRIATHECRYPKPNNAGFPVDQCLDCGGWRV